MTRLDAAATGAGPDAWESLAAVVERLLREVLSLRVDVREARHAQWAAAQQTTGRRATRAGPSVAIDPATLALRRRDLGLSQRQAAGLAGYSRGAIAAVECGSRRNPDTLMRYDAALARCEQARQEGAAP